MSVVGCVLGMHNQPLRHLACLDGTGQTASGPAGLASLETGSPPGACPASSAVHRVRLAIAGSRRRAGNEQGRVVGVDVGGYPGTGQAMQDVKDFRQVMWLADEHRGGL